MNRTLWLFIFVWLGFSPIAHASNSSKHKKAKAATVVTESPASTDEASTPTDKAPGEDVDEILTNKKMRAESGSKSRYSISNTINYAGSTIQHPFAEDRPNITQGTGSTNFASLTDSLAGKFSLDQTHAILAGFGIRWITPFQSDHIPANGKGPYNGTKFDAYDPYVRYQYVYRWYGIQSVLTASTTYTTQENLRRQGYIGNVMIQQNNAYDIGHTGLTLGLLTAIIGAGYSDRNPTNLANTSDYSFGFYPFLEYTINDWLNIRTISGVWVFEHIRNEPRWNTFFKDTIYQSIGVGISVTRDIFLYPNIQFIPEDIRADRTNVALSANINLF